VSQPIGAVFVLTRGVGIVYGLLDIFAPVLTTRWQVRSTAKHDGCDELSARGFIRHRASIQTPIHGMTCGSDARFAGWGSLSWRSALWP
jgi:hypothetical protein